MVLQPGSLIPQGSILRFVTGTTVQTRAPDVINAAGDKVQGLIYAVAPLLPAGDQSWSLQLVAGADLGAANAKTVQTQAALSAQASTTDPTPGSILLNDSHTGDPSSTLESQVPVASVIRTGTGSLSAGGGRQHQREFPLRHLHGGAAILRHRSADNLPQINQPGTNSVLGTPGNTSANGATYNTAIQDYQANYPTDGGNVLVSAQGTVTGDVVQTSVTAQGAGGNHRPAGQQCRRQLALSPGGQRDEHGLLDQFRHLCEPGRGGLRGPGSPGSARWAAAT